MNKKKQAGTNNQHQSSNFLLYSIIFLVIIITISSIYFITYYSPKEIIEENTHVNIDEIINDALSPDNINQAASIEILRIHKMGMEEEIRKLGNNWKNYPIFYIEAKLDGEIWKSIEINSWDTGYVDWIASRFLDEEREEIDITFSIIEKEKKLLRTIENEVEKFKVTYDFRTGRWMGDDYFNDSDGYGHIRGEEYEIWFRILQTEQDGDNIPYWWENNKLKTDPTVDDSLNDPDNDTIPTSWEWYWQYDPFVFDNHTALDPDEDGLSNYEEYLQRDWLANPYYKDIYLEVDFMEKGPGLLAIDHILHKESQWIIMDIFSPHKITLHIDDGWSSGLINGGGDMLPYIEEYLSPISGVVTTFYKQNFDDSRKGIFRYVLVHHSGGWCFPQTNTLRPDVLSIPSNHDYFNKVYFPPAYNQRLKRLAMAVAVIHELGHSLNLNPSYCAGIDNASQVGRNNLPPIQKLLEKIDARQYWDEYESVMNYHKFGQYMTEYSDGSHGSLDKNDWDQIDLTFFQKPIDEKYGIGDE